MGWTRRANPKWIRKASGQRYPSEVRTSVNTDRHGNAKTNSWEWDWTKSRYRLVRHVARVRRAAGKRQVIMGIEDYFDQLDAEYEDALDWYDDEEMDLPNWWYESWDDYEYPKEPFYDPYDDYFDDGYQV